MTSPHSSGFLYSDPAISFAPPPAPEMRMQIYANIDPGLKKEIASQ